MKIKLPKLCAKCSAEFWIDPKDNELEKNTKTGQLILACPICSAMNVIYVPPIEKYIFSKEGVKKKLMTHE